MNDALRKFNDNIDWTIVISTMVSAVIVGGSIYGMRKAGFNTGAKVLSAGK